MNIYKNVNVDLRIANLAWREIQNQLDHDKVKKGTNPGLRLDLVINGTLDLPSGTLITLELVSLHGY